MKTNLPSFKILKTGVRPLLQAPEKAQTFIFSLFILLLLGISGLNAQTSAVVPNTYVTGTFLGPLANNTRTVQLLIDDSQLTTLAGKYLTSISFRLNASAASALPVSDTTFPDYQIYLSESVEPANRQLNFAANVVGMQTQVRSGSLFIPAGSFSVGGNPNNFTFDITFNTPYLYNGTNLLIEIRHTGNNTSSITTHAASTSSTGYGTLFSSCWATTGNVMNANFTYVKINSIDALGVRSATLEDGLMVFPNPVKEKLFVKTSKEISEFNVFNYAGQKILSQKNRSRNPEMNTSQLAKGVYILQMIDKEGNSVTTKFVKE